MINNKPVYNMIVAYDLNNGIGKDNMLPWHFPEDLRRFSKLTYGQGNNAIIMGKNTWESIPKKPLPKRDNLILSTTLNLEEGSPHNTYIKTFSNIDAINQFCEEQKYETVWIIGGSKIYEQYINYNKLNWVYVTLIHKKYNCDVRFPDISSWKLVNKKPSMLNGDVYGYYQIYKK
jgi:dihydrofolate reductase